MKPHILAAASLILIVTLGCSLSRSIAISPPKQIAPTSAVELPTPTLGVPTEMATEPLQEISTEEPTEMVATAAPAMSAVPTQNPTVSSTAAPLTAAPIVLAGLDLNTFSINSFTVVDPASGMTQAEVKATQLSNGSSMPLVAANSIYMVDAKTYQVLKIDFDGTISTLDYINPTKKVFDGVFLPSPDGKRVAWADVSSFDSSGIQVTLKMANIDGTGEKALISEKRELPSRPDPVRWSNDGKSLYFTNMPYGIGGYILFGANADLQRMDLSTGTVKEILPNQQCLCDASISPDESKVAFINRPEGDQMRVGVLDIASGKTQYAKLPAGHLQAGAIIWSPDSKNFTLTSALGDPDKEAFTVLKFDSQTMSEVVLIPDDPRLLEPAAWNAPEMIWLNDKDENSWRLSPAGGSLTLTGQGKRVLATSYH